MARKRSIIDRIASEPRGPRPVTQAYRIVVQLKQAGDGVLGFTDYILPEAKRARLLELLGEGMDASRGKPDAARKRKPRA